MESMVGFNVMLSKNKSKNVSIVSRVSTSMISVLMLAGCLTAASIANAEDVVEPTATTETAAPESKSSSMLNSAGSAMDSTLDYFGFNHTRTDGLHKVYVGGGYTNSLLHAYVDAPTRFGHVYAKVGQFYAGDEIAGQIGFRMPYNYENAKNNNGVYFGAYAGHIENSSIGKEHKNRLGAAVEMSYLFLNKTSLTAASISIGGAQTEEIGNANQQKITPIVMFGLSWGYGLF